MAKIPITQIISYQDIITKGIDVSQKHRILLYLSSQQNRPLNYESIAAKMPFKITSVVRALNDLKREGYIKVKFIMKSPQSGRIVNYYIPTNQTNQASATNE
jgi:predicted ArsR family transcriptional regulator